MTDRITIPLVAYTALAAQLDEAQAALDRARKALAATKVYQAALDAEAARDRLQAQLDRFAPEEQQDARSEVGPTASVDHALAGSGGAREPAIEHDGGPTMEELRSGETYFRRRLANPDRPAMTPEERAAQAFPVWPATIDRDDPGPIPDCCDVTKRGT